MDGQVIAHNLYQLRPHQKGLIGLWDKQHRLSPFVFLESIRNMSEHTIPFIICTAKEV